jgi:hypothetical protein
VFSEAAIRPVSTKCNGVANVRFWPESDSQPATHVPSPKGTINAYHTGANAKNKWVRVR